MEDKFRSEEKIPLKDWRKYALGDGNQGYKSDEFYCALANDLYEILRPACGVGILPSENMHVLCVRLSQYVEDIVSGLGVFQAFRELNQSFDHRPLPFYDTTSPTCESEKGKELTEATNTSGVIDSSLEAYDPKLINVSDLKLLLWDFVMTFNTKKEIPSPFNPDYDRIARELKVIMDDAFRGAPKNEKLYQWLYPTEKFTGYADLKDRLIWLNRGCYLTASYSYDSQLSIVRNQGGRAEMDEGEEYRWFTKFTPKQNLEYFSEFLMFQNTTRLLSLPFHKFYAQMLKNKVRDDDAKLVDGIEGTFQKFKVRIDLKGNMHFFSMDGDDFVVEISDEFRCNVGKPEDIGFVVAFIVRFSGKWHLDQCRKYAYREECFETSEDYFWEKSTESYQKMLKVSEQAYASAKTLLQDKVIGFYRNWQVLKVELLEASYKNRIQEVKKLLEEDLDQKKKSRIEQELNEDLEGLRKTQKIAIEYRTKTSIDPTVLVIHNDECLTKYEDYVTDLDISSNPYTFPPKKPKESIEYVILHNFDYDLARTVLSDPTLKTSVDNVSDNMKRVRAFVVENVEFISRYCYHDCFYGLYKAPYKYPDGSIFR